MESHRLALQFGHYVRDYSRNRVLRRALSDNRFLVTEVHDETPNALRRWMSLLWQARKLDFDVCVVSFPGASDVLPARLLCSWRSRLLVYDAFISNYDTMVHDRRTTRPRSVRAAFYWLLDAGACHLADVLLVDTAEHAAYFASTFHVDKSKFHVVPVGTDESIMTRCGRPRNNDHIVFYGSYLPLHGAEHVVAAARRAEEEGLGLRWSLVGAGGNRADVELAARGLKTVMFHDPLPYGRLRDLLCSATICLGIFGNTEKAQRVVPNKVYDSLAVGRPLITGNTPAARSHLRDGEEALLVPTADAAALAAAVQALVGDPERAAAIAAAGHDRFVRDYSRPAVAAALARAVAAS